MPSANLVKEQSATGEYKLLANELVASAKAAAPPTPQPVAPRRMETPQVLLNSLRETVSDVETGHQLCADFVLDQYLSDDPVDQSGYEPCTELISEPELQPELTPDPITPDSTLRPQLPGQFVKIGPYELRPAIGFELPFGRDYQPIPYDSISRLAGYVGLDEFSLYVREVPNAPEYGLRPSRNGIWVHQPHELQFRRLGPGQAERITPETVIYIGGNGIEADTGLLVSVV